MPAKEAGLASYVYSHCASGVGGPMQRTVMARIVRFLCSAVMFLTPVLVAAQSRPIVLKTATVLDGKRSAARHHGRAAGGVRHERR